MSVAVFCLPDRLADKNRPDLIAGDAAQLTRVAERIAEKSAAIRTELDALRRSTDVRVEAGVARDQDIRRLTAELRRLSRVGTDVCLGRFVRECGTVVYVGRVGVTEADGTALLIDWRTPEAAPFFSATLGDPMGVVSRRHYRWSREVIVDYWDEVFAGDALVGGGGSVGRRGGAALDSQSSFIASLGASRSSKMTSVLGTIAADQDTAIRAGSNGPLVVEGGPGTGKTVVALHRAAYLLYSDTRLRGNRGEILIVGPHRSYLNYVGDVLPSLGEEGVATCTIADLVPIGDAADDPLPEADPAVAELKASAAMVGAVETAVAFYEEPPTTAVQVETTSFDLQVRPEDWAEAFAAVERPVVHNEARDDVWQVLAEVLVARNLAAPVGCDRDDEQEVRRMRAALSADRDLVAEFRRAWPMLDAEILVGDLWAVPAFLRHCAPWLSAEQRALLRQPEGAPITASDLPILDAARRRLGDADAARRRERRRAEAAAQQRVRDIVVDELIAADDGEGLVSMLRAEDIQDVIVDESGADEGPSDPLAGPFAHVVVDEAQDLTDAQWQMLLARCPSRSFTIVGDRAQARAGFAETWEQRLRRVGVGEPRRSTLHINYRTPAEVMDHARPLILAALPDVEVPESIRSSGVAVEFGPTAALETILAGWRADRVDGVACVIGAPEFVGDDRVASLTPATAKGLEFDLVVLVNPMSFGDQVAGAVDRYVAMTRSTSRLVVLDDAHSGSDSGVLGR
ncbi:RNA polymerase recycling motor ATPase HelR [Gordonia sp. (in: high G+C Gram-positive bacteria)]|uniref:RNA polymerase recycling motor ATPase HelR n=1 Tax=Gordonia sp. (in: high G+C Gram-positive bacteria) TaxID=84139 RepID=UPI0016B73249|nr:RNA polymerase recycling motor ATPase HelR [Gordonia sp. (in: high G+C Gram-positive bacteria)]NLG45792.1 AAA family ATPase [Gordonia sp. (in: high G+C Gram-positive bacteria)]